MPTFENAAADADEAQTALRALAHATRAINDPRQIYSVLGSLTSAVASLSQSLHQLAGFHDGAAKRGVWVAGDSRAGRAATYQVSWELTGPARSSTRSRSPSRALTTPSPALPMSTPTSRRSPTLRTVRPTMDCRCEGLERGPPVQRGPRGPSTRASS